MRGVSAVRPAKPDMPTGKTDAIHQDTADIPMGDAAVVRMTTGNSR